MKRKVKVLIGIGLALLVFVGTAFTPSSIERHVTRKQITAPKAKVWEVISDVGNYHQYATGLSSVTIVSGKGQGMVRSCSDEQGSWQETCTAWDEGTSYSFDVDTGSGFPYPFKVFNGTWTVNDLNGHTSELLISFEYQFPFRWMSWFFNSDTRVAIDQGNQTLVNNWEQAILKLAFESEIDE